MEVYNFIFPTEYNTLCVNLKTVEEPIGFNVNYSGIIKDSSLSLLNGCPETITQNVASVPIRIKLVCNILINDCPFSTNDVGYLERFTSGIINILYITGYNISLQIKYSLKLTYQFIKNKLQNKWIILNSNITFSHLSVT
jgi:hypothetical protein